MRHELTMAVRSLGRTPGFTLGAIATLGLALGAAIAIFSVVNAAVLAPPPYPDPGRLLVFGPGSGGAATAREFTLIRERSRSFATTAAQRTAPGWNLVSGTHAEFVEGLEISDQYFETHGVPLLLGRGVSPAEAQPGGPRTVVINERTWRRVFGGRPGVLGTVVTLGGRPHEIVGVAPDSFRTVPRAQVWSPLQVPPEANSRGLRVLGRLREGITYDRAVAEAVALRPALRAVMGDEARRADTLTWTPIHRWFSARTRELMIVLMAAVTALLLVAAVNVGGLQVARGLARARVSATRAALGATRGRLFREAFAESLLLSAAAGAVGLAAAALGTGALVSLLPADLQLQLLPTREAAIDWRVLAAALVFSGACALVFGIAPAIAGAHVDLSTAAGDAIRATASRRAVWMRRGFAVGQVALALVLLVAAGLLIRTFASLRSADLGFAPDGIVIGEMAVQGDTSDAAQRTAFIGRSLDGIRRVPGVLDAVVASAVPVDRPLNFAVQALGETLLPEPRAVDWAYTTTGYFDLFAIPLQAGRLLDDRDGQAAAPVAIVNAAFARAFFGRTNVVGETLQTLTADEPVREIVGVVGDVRAQSGSSFATSFFAMAATPAPMVYVPVAQLSPAVFRSVHQITPMRWVFRTQDGAAGVPEGVREILRQQDPRRPFRRFLTMTQIISRDVGLHRFLALLVAGFAATALSLAVLGLYGLVAHMVAQRRREIGIRLTLGATGVSVLRMFVSESVRLTAAGVVLGLIGAPYLTRAMDMFLIGVTPFDRATFGGVAALLLATAFAATLIAARRAARVDPAVSLRSDSL